MMKVFLLGLDGMTLRVARPYVDAGLLPNFRKVLGDGAFGVLQSTIPPITGPAWTSMATGKSPDKHGLYEFRKRNGYKTTIVTKNCSAAEPIWNILSRKGKHVAVINVPFTYPPDEVNGVMISGMMTPSTSSAFTYPKEIKRELFRIMPDYRLEVDAKDLFARGDKDGFAKEILKITRKNRTLMQHFFGKHPWDLFFFVFMMPDRLQHFLWDQVLAMAPECVECFQLLDDILGDILKLMDDDTVLIIASDHGFKPVSKVFYINSFLKKLHMLNIRGGRQIKLIGPIIFCYKTLARLGLLEIKKILPASAVNSVRNFLLTTGLGNRIDWRKTKAFSLLQYGLVSVNLKGREPQGIVDKTDYDGLCRMLQEEFLKLQDPQTGDKVVKAVYKSGHACSPPPDDGRPDLIVVANEGYLIVEKDFGDEIVGLNKRKVANHIGDHDLDGFFAAYGSIIKQAEITAHICDIMPTILYLTGTAVPDDLDGQVLTKIINEDFLRKNPLRFTRPSAWDRSRETRLRRQESEAVEKSLRSLGYIE